MKSKQTDKLIQDIINKAKNNKLSQSNQSKESG
jgi:hypothetical protein